MQAWPRRFPRKSDQQSKMDMGGSCPVEVSTVTLDEGRDELSTDTGGDNEGAQQNGQGLFKQANMRASTELATTVADAGTKL